jgi:GxxExxY protein
MEENELTHTVIGAAMEVHTALGPGLLEAAYQAAMVRELVLRNIAVEEQVSLGVEYKGVDLGLAYRLDLLVDDYLIVEIKSVEKILPIHEAQLLTYLRLANKPLGLLLNFHVPVMRAGVKRFVNSKAVSASSAPLR